MAIHKNKLLPMPFFWHTFWLFSLSFSPSPQPPMFTTLLSFLQPWMQVLVLLSFVFTSGAALVNVTVDDTLGDLLTGRKPSYSGTWFSSSNCSVIELDNPFCGLNLDNSSLLNGTWMGSATASSSVSILFNGAPLCRMSRLILGLFIFFQAQRSMHSS